jgi:hypothetical protein
MLFVLGNRGKYGVVGEGRVGVMEGYTLVDILSCLSVSAVGGVAIGDGTRESVV